jgi:hypothetical protein
MPENCRLAPHLPVSLLTTPMMPTSCFICYFLFSQRAIILTPAAIALS